MRTLKLIFIISLVLVTVGFISWTDSSASENVGAEKISVSKDAKPNVSNVNFEEIGTMVASWYGPGFHGRLTANGETYNQMALTAAHKELPFGTFLRITNQKNGKSAVVRINDRGPYIEGRDLDLSKGTAIALGMVQRGVIKVKVEEISLGDYNPPVVTLN
ncbi:MAG TPA: septal ring lytic transglycosylase RlpA family protein [Melioribacteraceae bacterium]|nr:septal ring lytic transglycosylase RlpA family protein [Melioribacteraceae bacterium]